MVKHVQHKPKPATGWKELASEIGVIVVGVLIALTAEQVVDALHWAHKIDLAERAMRLELADDDAPQAYMRLAIGRCLDQQVVRMQALVNARGDRRQYLALAHAYSPPQRTWDSLAWQTTVASDVGVHMGAEKMNAWSFSYRAIPYLSTVGMSETADLDGLAGVADIPGRLSEAESDQLSLVLRKVQHDNESTELGAYGLLYFVGKVGAGLSAESERMLLARARSSYGASCVATPGPVDERFRQFETTPELRRVLRLDGATN